jgi:hypothetical protein
MTVFESLLVAHIIGDWILQTEWQAVNKANNWRALWTHVLTYHAVVLVVLLARFGHSDFRVYIVVAALVVTHAALDRNRLVYWLMRVLRVAVIRPRERWLTVAFDQSIHLVLLALATLFLVR